MNKSFISLLLGTLVCSIHAAPIESTLETAATIQQQLVTAIVTCNAAEFEKMLPEYRAVTQSTTTQDQLMQLAVTVKHAKVQERTAQLKKTKSRIVAGLSLIPTGLEAGLFGLATAVFGVKTIIGGVFDTQDCPRSETGESVFATLACALLVVYTSRYALHDFNGMYYAHTKQLNNDIDALDRIIASLEPTSSEAQ